MKDIFFEPILISKAITFVYWLMLLDYLMWGRGAMLTQHSRGVIARLGIIFSILI